MKTKEASMRIVLLGAPVLLMSGCLGWLVAKDLANMRDVQTGLKADQFEVVEAGATAHGCTFSSQSDIAVKWKCPELPKAIACRKQSMRVVCNCIGKEQVCTKLIGDIVREGKAAKGISRADLPSPALDRQ